MEWNANVKLFIPSTNKISLYLGKLNICNDIEVHALNPYLNPHVNLL